MSNPFLGEIRILAGNTVPSGWALCNGAVLSIASNAALFSLLGTAYGGDGITTYALPDLRGRTPIGAGSGTSLTPRSIGEVLGTETVTLTTVQLPAHTHTLSASTSPATVRSPASGVPAAGASTSYQTTGTPVATGMALSTTTGGNAHANMQPYLCVSYMIATAGLFPPHG